VDRGNPTGTFRGIKRARNYLRRRCRITVSLPIYLLCSNEICLSETRGEEIRDETYIILYYKILFKHPYNHLVQT